MADDPIAPLRAAHRRGRVQGLFVASLSFGLGIFLVALHAMRLDPSTASMGRGTVVSLYAFAGIFVLAGFGLVWVALFRSGRDMKELERRLRAEPGGISLARRLVATRSGVQPARTETQSGAHQAHIEGADGRVFRLNASPAQVTAVLRMIQLHCPKATVEGLD